MGVGAGSLERVGMIDPDFWRDRRALVTGHTGFKGGWLCLWLEDLGARVTGYALEPSTTPSLFELADVGQGMRSLVGDVRDEAAVRSAFQEAEPEIVFHLAAQALVRRSYADPVDTWSTNVMGTLNVLEAARATPSGGAVVVVTSDKCYENREWMRPYREDDPMGGADPYSASKGATELLASSYRRSFLSEAGPKLATGRAGNVIGGGDYNQDRLIPDLVAAAMASTPAIVRNPDAVRPWQHVLEPLAGYLLLAERLHQGDDVDEGWNFGPDTEGQRTVGEVVERFGTEWGAGAEWTAANTPGPHEATLLALDSEKARQKLGWRPRWTFDTAIEATVSWYREVAGSPSAARAHTLAQIHDY